MDLAQGQRINCAASVKRKEYIFRLLNQARRIRLVGFGRINQKEAKDVFFAAGAGVKTISIIGGVEDETTILEDSPISRCAKVNSRPPETWQNHFTNVRCFRSDSRMPR